MYYTELLFSSVTKNKNLKTCEFRQRAESQRRCDERREWDEGDAH